MARLLLAAFLAAAIGCKEEAKPSSDLKVPDVPESGSNQGKGDMSKTKGKK